MRPHSKIAEHLTIDELYQKYRDAKCPVERVHWQIIWWRAQGKKTVEVAALTGYRPDWIRQIVRRYNARGPEGLGDHRIGNGNKPMLSGEQQRRLITALMGPAPDGGLWNCTKVAQWMSEELGWEVKPQRGWDYLRRLGFTPQRPRPRHVETSKEAQEGFKKNSARRWKRSGKHTPTQK